MNLHKLRLTDKTVKMLALLSVALTAALAVYYVHAAYLLVDVPETRIPSVAAAEVPVSDFSGVNWQLVRRTTEVRGTDGPVAGRYRLAGTFMAFDNGDETTMRRSARAIIDDLQERRQELVREGEELNGLQVLRIYRERVVVAMNGVEEELWMDFRGGVASRSDEPAAEEHNGLFPDPPPGRPEVLEETRFGQRVGDTRWELNRQALMDYYQEVIDDPERAVALYESMRPVRSGNQIEGFSLSPAGEQELFSAMGLHEGDVIRRVNSLEMINQQRAEYFLREFAQDRLEALVLDIERDGEERKLIYLMY